MRLKWNPSLRKRSLLTLFDVSDTEMLDLINLAVALKARRRPVVTAARTPGRSHRAGPRHR